jgi:hypothetical protein
MCVEECEAFRAAGRVTKYLVLGRCRYVTASYDV